MSNSYQNDDTIPPVSNTVINSTRPQQKGTLALLPTEILYQIAIQTKPLDQGPIETRPPRIFNKEETTEKHTTESSTLSATDLKNLGLASSNLFYHIRPLYYRADNFQVFRSALEHADVDAMGRCAEFGAAPDMHWDLEDPCYQRHVTHRPVDVLLESVHRGLAPIGKPITALQWLVDHGYDVYEQKLHPHDLKWAQESGAKNWMRKLDPLLKSQRMPKVLIQSVNRSSDRYQTEGICQMIRMLLAHGCLLPYNLGRYTPLEIAMRSHCPPHFLELLLDQYKQHDARVKDWRDGCPKSMITWVGHERWMDDDSLTERVLQRWAQMSCLGDLACSLWNELMFIRQMCKQKYYGDITDVFEEKVKLLIKYEFVDETEQRAFVSIVEALRDITSMTDPSGDLNVDRDGKTCWTRLFDALRISAANENIASVRETLEGPQRIHRFIFDETRNPWSSWYKMTLDNESYWNEFSRPWLKEQGLRKVPGRVEDPVWDELVSESLFEWHEFDYDGYVMRIGQLWMEKEEQKRKVAFAEGDREGDLLEDLDDGVVG
ncbi:uncharacterized protein B0J16DRAFT_392010 [Fusarium flagelliforme]|uniref:Uncharacterized protein n=1 Tax=Fusarium flagelliforme TaxID=2675880 RepID=A0A395N5Y9_9HYPO|nr:uncharacterized protein B0J16DRAFT_392010 [Fusarium flagelliforme]KAH7198311.1 hypothetical protein B0J16DRAFT_392010 [Fusarium flagelliforme]RFN55290.1 hypothetical protein FIE12Z_543 [Fusarium flagelliforme]